MARGVNNTVFGNFPLLEYLKRLSLKKEKYKEEDFAYSLYDIFNSSEIKPWEVLVTDYDRTKIQSAQKSMQDVAISQNLNDLQLLKLHSPTFLDFDYILIYNTDFEIYEVKEKSETIYLFSYRNGLYTPIDSIF